MVLLVTIEFAVRQVYLRLKFHDYDTPVRGTRGDIQEKKTAGTSNLAARTQACRLSWWAISMLLPSFNQNSNAIPILKHLINGAHAQLYSLHSCSSQSMPFPRDQYHQDPPEVKRADSEFLLH